MTPHKIVLICLALIGFELRLPAEELDPGLWQLIHPNSKALIGIQWTAVQHSEAGQWLRQRWIGDLEVPGVDFAKDVQQVLISSPGRAGGEEPPLLIAVRGTFHRKRVEEALLREGTTRHMFSGVAVYRPRGKAPLEPSFALLNQHVILVGDTASLYSTIERSRLPRPTDEGSFLERAQSLDARYDCWALLSDPSSMQSFMFASMLGKTMAGETQGFEAGISVRDGFAIDVLMNARSERSAQTIQGHLTGAIQRAAQEEIAPGGFSSLLAKLRVSTDHANVRMSLKMTDAEAAQSMQVQARSIAKETPRVIRIEGLDDGPRALPFKP